MQSRLTTVKFLSNHVYLFISIEDNMKSFGWLKHDGKNFGSQELIDSEKNCKVTTSFIKTETDSEVQAIFDLDIFIRIYLYIFG